MKRTLLVAIPTVIGLGVGFVLGVYSSIPGKQKMRAEFERESLALYCRSSYKEDQELLGYFTQLHADMMAAGKNRGITKQIESIQNLTQKKLAAYKSVCTAIANVEPK